MYLFICYIWSQNKIYKSVKRKFDTFSVEGSCFFWQEVRTFDLVSLPAGHVEWTGNKEMWPHYLPGWSRGVDRKLGHFTLFSCRASHVEGQEVMSCNFVSSPAGNLAEERKWVNSNLLKWGHYVLFPASWPLGGRRKWGHSTMIPISCTRGRDRKWGHSTLFPARCSRVRDRKWGHSTLFLAGWPRGRDRKWGHSTWFSCRLATWMGQEMRSFHLVFLPVGHVDGTGNEVIPPGFPAG